MRTLWALLQAAITATFQPPTAHPADVDDLMALADCLYDDNTTQPIPGRDSTTTVDLTTVTTLIPRKDTWK